jgi:predicted dehydrogenase
MRALVVGGGSIGKRHLDNLIKLGISPLAVVEPDSRRLEEVCKKTCPSPEGFLTIEEGLKWKPNFVIICSPSNLHVEQAIKAAKKGCHLFIEKPLSHNKDGLTELSKEVEKRGIISIVGCNMRFHPGPSKVKELIDKGVLGKIFFAHVYTGSYLPGWRPWQDYRKSYSAQSSLGGGCILDCIHEIDLTLWYLGDVKEVFCFSEHISSLEMDVEDIAQLVCKHANGAISDIHLDYIQQTYERGCQIVGEKGSIFWEFNEKRVKWFDATEQTWKVFQQPETWEFNQVYIDEMKHFLESIEKGTPTVLSVSEAIKVMNVVFAAKNSAFTHCTVSL